MSNARGFDDVASVHDEDDAPAVFDEVPGMFPEKPQQSAQVSLGNLALHPQCLAVRGSIETRD